LDKKEIIEQGHLATYLTGELTDIQRGELEDILSNDFELRSEYQDLESVLERLSFTYGIEPTPAVKKMLMEHPSVLEETHFQDNANSSSIWRFAFAASVSIAIISTISAFYFYTKWIDTDDRLAKATIQNIELAENFDQVNQQLDGMRDRLDIMVSPEFSRIILNGTAIATENKTVIYWNKAQEEIYLNSANLPELSENQQYQLWALVDGKPIDAGVFDADGGQFQIMKRIARADAFAVTIEQSGGADSPTLSTMQVYGET
jgi:anti-sigma-K factor RskA